MTEIDNPNPNARESVADALMEARMIRIMQYCDGALPPREAAAVAAEIARDPEAARLAAEFSAGADAARLAWNDLESGPVPFDLARRVRQAAQAPVQTGRPRFAIADLRMAAALLIGCLLGALALALVQQGGGDGLRLAGVDSAPQSGADQSWKPALVSALAKDSATAPIAFTDAAGVAGTVRVARWFDTATGQRCAEFVTSRPDTAATGGIACRKRDGSWDVLGQE